jgi:hypothetical protein
MKKQVLGDCEILKVFGAIHGWKVFNLLIKSLTNKLILLNLKKKLTKVEILLAHVSHRYKNDVAHLAHSRGRDGPKKCFQNDTFFSQN